MRTMVSAWSCGCFNQRPTPNQHARRARPQTNTPATPSHPDLVGVSAIKIWDLVTKAPNSDPDLNRAVSPGASPMSPGASPMRPPRGAADGTTTPTPTPTPTPRFGAADGTPRANKATKRSMSLRPHEDGHGGGLGVKDSAIVEERGTDGWYSLQGAPVGELRIMTWWTREPYGESSVDMEGRATPKVEYGLDEEADIVSTVHEWYQQNRLNEHNRQLCDSFVRCQWARVDKELTAATREAAAEHDRSGSSGGDDGGGGGGGGEGGRHAWRGNSNGLWHVHRGKLRSIVWEGGAPETWRHALYTRLSGAHLKRSSLQNGHYRTLASARTSTAAMESLLSDLEASLSAATTLDNNAFGRYIDTVAEVAYAYSSLASHAGNLHGMLRWVSSCGVWRFLAY